MKLYNSKLITFQDVQGLDIEAFVLEREVPSIRFLGSIVNVPVSKRSAIREKKLESHGMFIANQYFPYGNVVYRTVGGKWQSLKSETFKTCYHHVNFN